MQKQNEERLHEILSELQNIGDEIEEMTFNEKEVEYELSEVGSGLVDARVELRKILK